MSKKTLTAIAIYTRPSLEIPFFTLSEEENSHIQQIELNRVIHQEFNLSEDELVLEVRKTYKSYQDRRVIFKDSRYMDIYEKEKLYNIQNLITVVFKSYEGDDSSLAISSLNMVARYSASDPLCMNNNSINYWKDSIKELGIKIDPFFGTANAIDSVLEVDDLLPIGSFEFNDEEDFIRLDGQGYFSTQDIGKSDFANINHILKSFFICFIPDIDNNQETSHLISKYSSEADAGWFLCYKSDGSVTLRIASDSVKNNYSTSSGSIVSGVINTIGINVSLSGDVNIFVNGQELLSSYHGNDIFDNNFLLSVGGNSTESTRFVGKLLGFRVYYRYLDQSEFNILHRLFVNQYKD